MSTCEGLFPLNAMAVTQHHSYFQFCSWFLTLLYPYFQNGCIHDTYQTLKEMMLVLDSSQITIYLDVNSDKNLPISKKYLTSAIVPMMGISGVMGKPKQEVSLDNSTSIEDQCHML